ncbi:MAG: hypothetical protein CMA66_00075 [Euryarchaeota archaeon]|jgi:hypothetical protein|nr:hypothetical protein [Euryarchaeota archaeon]
MNHPLWPVVREAARRIVRLENLEIYAPNEFRESINELSSKISDHIPQRANFPKHVVDKENNIKIYDYCKKVPKLIIEVGLAEPEMDVCWVKMTSEVGFTAIIDSCLQLLEAGYPGCIGCDDSIQEGRWDEKKFRNSLQQNSV